MNKKVMLSKQAAEVLVEIWSAKGQITPDLKAATLHYLLNHEFERTRLERWAREVQIYRAARAAA